MMYKYPQDLRTEQVLIPMLGRKHIQLLFDPPNPIGDTKEELIKKESDPHFYFHDRYRYTPTGRLSLMAGYYGSNTLCSDGRKRSLEDLLNEGIIGLIKIALEKKEIRIRRAREEREWEEKRRLHEEAERLRKAEEARFAALLKEAENWERSRQLSEYIDAVQKTVVIEDLEITQRAKIERWLDWAKQKAHLLDPVSNGRIWQQVSSLEKS